MSDRSQYPNVSAVVLNWRDADSTRRCVESLLADPGIANVVLVDNESTGDLRALKNDRVVLLEQNLNLGFSRGVNIGLRHVLESQADAALVINNDAVLDAGCVPALITEWEGLGAALGLAAPVVLNPDGTEQSTGGRFRAFDASTNDLVDRASVNYLTWACVLIPRKTLETVGLLDESFFMYWEDVDYGLRVGDAGLTLAVVNGAHVIHEKSKSHGKAGVAIERYSARGLTLLCHKRGGVAKHIGLPYRLAGRVVSRIPHGWVHVRAILDGVRDAHQTGRRRKS